MDGAELCAGVLHSSFVASYHGLRASGVAFQTGAEPTHLEAGGFKRYGTVRYGNPHSKHGVQGEHATRRTLISIRECPDSSQSA